MKEGNRPNKGRARVIALFLLSQLFFLGPASSADNIRDIDWTISLSPDSLYIGDQLTLTVELLHSSDTDVNLTGVSADFAPFEIVGGGEVKTSGNVGAKVDSLTLSLVTFETGEYFLGPIKVLVTRDGQPDTLTIEGKSVFVRSVLDPGAKDIKEIKGLIPPATSRRFLWYLLGLIPLALFVYLLWVRHRNRGRKRDAAVEAERLVPPDIWAFDQLRKIEGMELLSRGKVKKHYILVTDVLRKYAFLQFGVVTLERTSREILEDLQSAALQSDQIDTFSNLFEESDLVKFAKWIPPISTSESFVERTREIIRSTSTGVEQEEETLAVR